MEIVKISKDNYIFISLYGPAKFRTDSRFLQKSRSDLNKENRVVATVVGRYGIYGTCMVMEIPRCRFKHIRISITMF